MSDTALRTGGMRTAPERLRWAFRVATTAVVVIVVVLGVRSITGSGGYHVNIVFPVATNLGEGSLVESQGFPVGHVTKLGVNDGQALVGITLSSNAPLHTGTTAAIDYKSLLGERYVEITPGPATNPAIPSGGLVTGGQYRVEISQVVSTLTPQLRSELVQSIPQLQGVLQGSGTTNAQSTLTQAGPAVNALGQVLDAVGQDGRTLNQLVTSLASLSNRLVNHQNDVVGTVQGLDRTTSSLATQTSALGQSLQSLPSTLTAANATLSKLPGTTSAALPLLSKLQPTAAALPTFSQALQPVLTELQPVSSEAVGTLSSLKDLLTYTPGLLTTTQATEPSLAGVVTQSNPAVNFLRPYSPELAGFFANWGSWLSDYATGGPLAPFYALAGTSSVDGFAGLPGLTGLGSLLNEHQVNDPQPGQVAGGQTWTDAAGNPIR